MAVTVSVFNANTLGVVLQVNNGPQVQIEAAVGPTFAPASPTANGPTWDPAVPSGNVFAPGDNSLLITPNGVVTPYALTANLPSHVNWTSLQFYIFWNTSAEVSWMALNNGQPVSGAVSQKLGLATDDGC